MGKLILNGRMLEATDRGKLEYGKIECTGYDEYYFYNEEGNGGAIAKLNSVEVTELFFTGEVRLGSNFVIINPEHSKS